MKETNLYMKRNYSGFKMWSALVLVFLLGTSQIVVGQQAVKTTVKGLIRDAITKKPVAAARVLVPNTTYSTTTDSLGLFQLEVANGKELLQIEAYDFNICQYPVLGRDSVLIELNSNLVKGYFGTLQSALNQGTKSLNTTSNIGTNDINSYNAFTPYELIQTELGGSARAIAHSAQMGQGASVFIRGLNSLNANAQPLYVVDGVIWNSLYDVNSIHSGFIINPLSNIEMADVESVTILKDATSIYGSKAANGVVLIKTKRANDMSTKIDLNIVTGVTTKPSTMPVMNNNDFKIYLTEMLGTTGLSTSEIETLPFMNDDPARFTYPTYHNNTNWEKEIYKTAISKSYSINVRGGDEKALYYFSLGYTGNDGVVKSTDLERFSVRLNGDIKMFNKVDLGVNVAYVRTDRRLVDDGINFISSPTWISKIKAPFLSPYTYTYMGEKTTEFEKADIFNLSNPVALLEMTNNTVKQNNFNLSLIPKVQISKSVTLKNTFDYSLNKINEDTYSPYLYAGTGSVEGIGTTYNSRASQVIRNNAIFNDLRVTYQTKLDNGIGLTVDAGSRFIYNNFESDFVVGYNSMSNTSTNLLGSFRYYMTDGVNTTTKSISNYASVEANYENRYLLSATAAMDASSRFGNEIKGALAFFGRSWGVFPSVNAAWLMSSEKFMKPLSFINYLKWRAGYGITGNDDIQDYQTLTYFSPVRFTSVGNGMVINRLANPAIQWETTGRANVGLDMNLFNDRILISVDAFSSVTNNLLVERQFQDVVGLNSYWTNSGKLTNKGIEASVTLRLLQFKRFVWELGASAGLTKNELTELPNGPFITSLLGAEVLSQVGNPVGVFYGYKSLGVFASTAEAQTASTNGYLLDDDGNKFQAGDVHFQDVNSDGVINESDKQIIGDPNPTVYGTFSSKIAYRNFTLSALFTYSYGNEMYNYQRRMLESGTYLINQSTALLRRWTAENQETTQPRAYYGDPMGNARFSDRWIEDGSYIRLKTLSLSYTQAIKSNFIEGITIWASANNLLTFSNYLGSNPEASVGNRVLYQGIDAGLLPQSKSFNLGLKINL